MKIVIHHYHHFGATDLQICLQFKKGLFSVEKRLDTIMEKLNFMANEEQQLNDTIAALRDETTAGFKSISESVGLAAERVIQRLKERDEDLTDEIKLLEQLKAATRSAATDTVAQLDQIGSGGRQIPAEESTEPSAGDDTADDERVPADAPPVDPDITSGRKTAPDIPVQEPFVESRSEQDAAASAADQARTPVPTPPDAAGSNRY